MTLRIAAISVALALVAFAATTWWALESFGIATVETRRTDGSLRQTHVWYVEPDGELWLEAGSPENGWFLDVLDRPDLIFDAERRSGEYRAEPLDGDLAHQKIRALIGAKYGLRERWVGMLVDTSRSVAVRLAPAKPN